MKISEMPFPYNTIRRIVLLRTGELRAGDEEGILICTLEAEASSLLLKENPIESYQGPGDLPPRRGPPGRMDFSTGVLKSGFPITKEPVLL